jgi:hypothetical protein
LESFIYAIAKTFKPFDDSDELHLVELGFSKFEDFNSSYNGLSRLSGLKTGLISFKVHRLYLYDSSFDTNLKSSRALQAEQRLHTAIEEDYKPGQGRKRDRVELELVVELTRTRELLYGFGASSFPSSRSFEFEFDEATKLRDRVFTEFLWKRLKSWFEFEKRHFPSTGRGPKGSPF